MDNYLDGMTTVYNQTSNNMYKIIYYNTNTVDYRTDYICQPPANLTDMANPKFIAIHEFGHFAGLDHPYFELFVDGYHTAMKKNCNQGYASLSSEDKNQINN
ncbi:MAG: hypothetical protein QW050_01815 [Candidatus Nitrosocaldaceae archaeon]